MKQMKLIERGLISLNLFVMNGCVFTKVHRNNSRFPVATGHAE